MIIKEIMESIIRKMNGRNGCKSVVKGSMYVTRYLQRSPARSRAESGD